MSVEGNNVNCIPDGSGRPTSRWSASDSSHFSVSQNSGLFNKQNELSAQWNLSEPPYSEEAQSQI